MHLKFEKQSGITRKFSLAFNARELRINFEARVDAFLYNAMFIIYGTVHIFSEANAIFLTEARPSIMP